MTIEETARAHHAAIEANVAEFVAGLIDHGEFSRRACALHAASRADGPAVEAALLDLIIAKLPSMLREPVS